MYRIRNARSAPSLVTVHESGSPGLQQYRDRHFKCPAIRILPGEYCVTDRDIVLVTTLGSCVAACLRDPLAGVGGLNHFLLPDGGSSPDSESSRYGGYAMEVLINDLIKRGASRQRLEAKLFGAGNVSRHYRGITVGARNIAFVEDYLAREAIPVVAEDLGGRQARKVYFWPLSGRVMVQSLPQQDEIELCSAEDFYLEKLGQGRVAGAVELFAP